MNFSAWNEHLQKQEFRVWYSEGMNPTVDFGHASAHG